MHKVTMRGVVMALTLGMAGVAGAAVDPDATRWQAMARADLDAMHARIVQAHPGVIDAANPGFNSWVAQGYAQAQGYLPYVVSYDTAMAVLRYYAAGFEDGHLMVSDDIRRDFPILVTGWDIAWKDGSYVVVAALPHWSVPLPPVGATWTGCDGLAAEEVMQARVAPFSDRRPGEESRRHRAMSLWMRRPVARDLGECTFRTADGATLALPVAYQPVTTEQFFSALPQTHDGGSRAPNAFDLRDGVLWVRAGNFMLREDSADRQELEAMLAGLAQAREVRAIVFDARGNHGGDSGIGDRIFAAATGGLDYDQTGLDALPRYYAQWRVSDFLVHYLDQVVADTARLYGADDPRVGEERQFRDRVSAARAAGQPWVEQDAGRTITRADVVARHGHLHRFDARVALLTDGGCVSACLDFADVVLQVPGVVHVGQTTGADSVYLVGSHAALPSGNALVMPVKVWRNRTRGNNQALVPDVPVDLDDDEAAVRRNVLHALGIE
jgi:hypothetical protein